MESGARLRPLASLDAGQTAARGVDAVVLPESESGAYRLDRRLRAPTTTSQVDRQLAQHLLDGFLAAGAKVVFVGFSTGLRGPHVVVPYPSHETHMHVRFPTPPS